MKKTMIVLFITLIGCSGEAEHDWGEWSKEKMDSVSVVSVAPAGLGTVSAYITTNSVVESEAQADVFPQATGRVLKVFKDDGDRVRKGDVLAVLENVSLDANAQRAVAELAKQKADTEKLRSLYSKGAISEKELADGEYLLNSAKTGALEAKHSFGETKLRAPFDGVVAVREVRVGETASGGKRAFQIVDLQRLRVIASLPERDMGRVVLGQSVQLVSAYDPALTAVGTVVRLAPVVDASSGTFRVTVGLSSDQIALRPGQFVEVKIEIERRIDVLTVPRPAVVYEDGLPVVFWMTDPPPPEEDADEEKEDAKKPSSSWWGANSASEEEESEEDTAKSPKKMAKRMSVELGLMDDDFAEILSGINADDLIVHIGQSNLKDGVSVRTPEMMEAAAALKKERDEAKKAADADAEKEGGE